MKNKTKKKLQRKELLKNFDENKTSFIIFSTLSYKERLLFDAYLAKNQ